MTEKDKKIKVIMQFKNKKAILFHHDLEVKIIFFFNILIKKEN